MSALNPLFFLVLLIALSLRLPLLKSGMPFVLSPDEANYIPKILYLLKHFLNPHCAAIPGFFLYLNSLVLFLSTGSLNINALITMLDVNPASIYVPLRMISLIFNLGSIVVVFLIGNLFSYMTGIIASSLLSLALIHVMFSHVLSPLSMLIFCLLLSTFFALRAYLKNSLNILKASVIATLLSASAHYIGVIGIVPVLFVMAFKKDFTKLRAFLVLFLIVFIVLNPYAIFYLPFSLAELVKNYLFSYYNHHSGSYLLYLFGFLIPSVGPIAWIASFFLIKYKKDYDSNLLKILFSLPLFYFAILGLLHFTSPGFATVLIPYFCLSAGLVFNSIYNEIPVHWRTGTSTQWFVLIVLFLLTFYIPLKYTFKYNKLIGLSDTRVLATEWIKENTSDQYKIAWDKNSIQMSFHDVYNKKDLLAVVDDKEVLINKQKFSVTAGLLKKKDWLKYFKKKVDYAVINSLDYERVLRQPGSSPEKKYYTRILKLKPQIVFNPYLLEKEKKIRSLLIEDLYMPVDSLWYRERPGPVIKIYKL